MYDLGVNRNITKMMNYAAYAEMKNQNNPKYDIWE